MKPNDIRNAYDKTPLAEIHQMYRDFPDKDAIDEYNREESLLHIAATFADPEAIDILLSAGAKANVTHRYGHTLLHNLAELDFRCWHYEIPPGAIRECVFKLMDAKVSPLRKDDEGDTCLHLAAKVGNHEFLAALVERGAKLDMADKNGDTPLHIICEESGRALSSLGYAERNLEQARERAAKETHRIYQEQLADSEKSYKKDKDKFDSYFLCAKVLVDAGVDVDEKNNYGKSALDVLNGRHDQPGDKRIAAVLGGYYVEEGSADEGGEADLRLKTGGMTLHQAVGKGDHEAVKANIALGADLNSVDNGQDRYNRTVENQTPLGLAILGLDYESVKLLLEAGADPNFKDGDGKTPLKAFCRAIVGGKVFEDKIPDKILEELKKHGLDINGFIDDELNTPLNEAAKNVGSYSGYNYFSMPKTLFETMLDWGADVNISNAKGVTPLMYVSAKDDRNAENYQISLLEAGADIAARDVEGNTPLMYACKNRSKAMAKTMADMLVSFGDAQIAAVNNAGESALDMATTADNEPLVKYLLGKM